MLLKGGLPIKIFFWGPMFVIPLSSVIDTDVLRLKFTWFDKFIGLLMFLFSVNIDFLYLAETTYDTLNFLAFEGLFLFFFYFNFFFYMLCNLFWSNGSYYDLLRLYAFTKFKKLSEFFND